MCVKSMWHEKSIWLALLAVFLLKRRLLIRFAHLGQHLNTLYGRGKVTWCSLKWDHISDIALETLL